MKHQWRTRVRYLWLMPANLKINDTQIWKHIFFIERLLHIKCKKFKINKIYNLHYSKHNGQLLFLPNYVQWYWLFWSLACLRNDLCLLLMLWHHYDYSRDYLHGYVDQQYIPSKIQIVWTLLYINYMGPMQRNRAFHFLTKWHNVLSWWINMPRNIYSVKFIILIFTDFCL